MSITKEYIKLAHANLNQITSGSRKSEWEIKANITGELLGVLPSKLTDSEVLEILKFARKFELDAFNAGIDFGKEKSEAIYSPQLAQLKEINRLAANENERLADILEKTI